MGEKDYAIEEYKLLRNEIIQMRQNRIALYTFLFSISGVIFGYAVQNGKFQLLIAPLSILTVGIYLIIGQWEHAYRIGGYIKTFLEPQFNGLNWETCWGEISKEGKLPPRCRQTIPLLLSFFVFQVMCLLLAYPAWKVDNLLFILLYPALALHIIYSTRYALRACDPEKHGSDWKTFFQSKNSPRIQNGIS